MTLAALPQPTVTEQATPVLPPVEAPEQNPLAGFARALRGRWKRAMAGAAALGAICAGLGYLAGVQLYEAQAILRVFPQETNILYSTGEASVLKTFDSFVKAETTYVASHPVMSRAVDTIAVQDPETAGGIRVSDLAGSVEIRRSDSLIILKTKSRDPGFAQIKLDAVVSAYLTLKNEAKEARSAVRLAELYAREQELVERLTDLRATQLEVGGEYGMNALAKAHIEKIAQIDGLAARKSEVAATLIALEANSGGASADTSDEEIMRATLLDRAMADLNFERAKLMSQLAGLRAGYQGQNNARFELKVAAKLDEIAVIEKALADRREQIKVLGQTGALTDASAEGTDTSLADIRALYTKVEGQLANARKEARDLNRRRIELDQVEQDIDEAQKLLEETRRALEVIRLETGRALPGYAVLMSPASRPTNPVSDSRKMLAAAGLVGGAGLSLLIALGLGMAERRVRFAETLSSVEHRVPVLQVSDAGSDDAQAADLLRNELQLRPLRHPRLVGKAPIIAVTCAADRDTTELARALAASYARARMKALFVEGDIVVTQTSVPANRWRSVLSDEGGHPRAMRGSTGAWELRKGPESDIDDTSVSAPMVRRSLDKLVGDFDVIVVSAGSLTDRLASKFVLSASDVGVVEMYPGDAKDAVLSQIDCLDTLPRNGSVAVMRNALPADPWLSVRT
ncbi:hypothetical protein TRL7639_03893 [Falsiruegeria litorea R37]|uniref:Chain length determinant protein n=1 Tax=Falsiruegeria litorea R37 TaxID=1200284 RepID=A0A1Y5TMF9_9RHOB|nr:hypothetical protein [Falsiruegeria litorea]SLN67533.1 hypothetical protein TRL7639_03893 [Falsiruegeria litorea R37]